MSWDPIVYVWLWKFAYCAGHQLLSFMCSRGHGINCIFVRYVYRLHRVTTCLENVEMSGNLITVREMSRNLSGNNIFVRENLVRENCHLECEWFIISLCLHCCGWQCFPALYPFTLQLVSIYCIITAITLVLASWYEWHFNLCRRFTTIREVSGYLTMSWEWSPCYSLHVSVFMLINDARVSKQDRLILHFILQYNSSDFVKFVYTCCFILAIVSFLLHVNHVLNFGHRAALNTILFCCYHIDFLFSFHHVIS